MIATINGLPVLRSRVCMPRRGVWIAQIDASGEEAISGDAILRFDELDFHGTVLRGDVDNGRLELLVVGGAGGLGEELAPKYYADAPASIPINDVVRECGETLASTVSSSLLATMLARWTRSRARGGVALAALAGVLGAQWRVLQDGTLWLGLEDWPVVSLDRELVEDDPAHARRVFAVDAFTLRPGTVLDGRQLSYVMHELAPRSTRTTVWFE
jgi:hypothetical protein